MFLSVRLNFRRPIYPPSHSLAKIFQHVTKSIVVHACSFRTSECSIFRDLSKNGVEPSGAS